MHSIQDNNSIKNDVLRVKQLTVSTATGQLLVDQLSFDLREGETVAIVGESGSGKSVSSLALLGLLPSHLNIQGQACLNDQDLLALDSIALRQFVGKKFHDFPRTNDCFKSFTSC